MSIVDSSQKSLERLQQIVKIECFLVPVGGSQRSSNSQGEYITIDVH